MYICLCRGITESKLRELGRQGFTSADALIEELGLEEADACGFCARHIDEIVAIAEGHAEAGIGLHNNAREHNGGSTRGG